MKRFAVALTAVATMGSLALMTDSASAQMQRWSGRGGMTVGARGWSGGAHWGGIRYAGNWSGTRAWSGYRTAGYWGWRRPYYSDWGWGAAGLGVGLGLGLAAASTYPNCAYSPWYGYDPACYGYAYPATTSVVYGNPAYAVPAYTTTRVVYAGPARTRYVRAVSYGRPYGVRTVRRSFY